MENNGIEVDIDIDTALVDTQQVDNILTLKEKRLEEFREEIVSLSGDDPKVLDTSLLSSLSQIEPMPRLLSKEETLTEPIISKVLNARTPTSVETLAEFIIPDPEEKTLSFPSDMPLSINQVLNNAMNSTASTDLPMNMSTSSWSAEEIGAVSVISVMVPFILCSNLLVIMSVSRFRRLHTPTNYFITSLAAVDIFVALATPFVVVVEVFHFGEGSTSSLATLVCLLPNRILMMTCGVSLLTLATIAYDRHTALVCPLEYVNIMTSRKVIAMVSAAWIYSAFIVWLPLMAGWYDPSPSFTVTYSAKLLHDSAHILFLSAIFLPSSIAILVCYFRIFIVARHHAKAIAAAEFAVHRRLQVKFMIKDTKYAKTLALVIGVFLALWLPYLVCMFIEIVSSISFSVWLHTYLTLLAVFNSGINPWIYAFKNNEFKAAFKRMFQEYVKERFYRSEDRQRSLVPGVSTTPRLSRTDSRMISTMLEPTVDSISDKLKRSLDSLDEFEHDFGNKGSLVVPRKSYTIVVRDERPGSEPSNVVSSLAGGLDRRQVLSCSDLASAAVSGDNYNQQSSASRTSRSFSADYSALETTDNPATDIPTSPDLSCYQTRKLGLGSDDESPKDSTFHQRVQSIDVTPHELIPCLRAPHSETASSHMKKVSSISSPGSLSPPPRRHPRASSWSTPASPSIVQALLSPTISSLSSPLSSPLPSPSSSSSSLLSSVTGGVHQPQSTDAVTFSYMNEALQGDCVENNTHYGCHDNSAAFHPFFQTLPNFCVPHLECPQTLFLSHTRSCPTFALPRPFIEHGGSSCAEMAHACVGSSHSSFVRHVV